MQYSVHDLYGQEIDMDGHDRMCKSGGFLYLAVGNDDAPRASSGGQFTVL